MHLWVKNTLQKFSKNVLKLINKILFTNIVDYKRCLNSNFESQNKNIAPEPIMLLDDSKSRGAGTYTLKESLSNFRKINIILCATTEGANTTCYEIPVNAFKNLYTDSYGWMLSALDAQFIYVKYIDDTSVKVDSVSKGYLRTIYGIK